MNFESALKALAENTNLAFAGIYGTQLTFRHDFLLDGIPLQSILSGEEYLHDYTDVELEQEWKEIEFLSNSEIKELIQKDPDFMQNILDWMIHRL